MPAAPVRAKSEVRRPRPFKVISGGQTGVDRAALDAAMELGIEVGGWCPRGRRAEDGVIPARYRLRETKSAGYKSRSRRNVWDADGVLMIQPTGGRDPGTAFASFIAHEIRKPVRLLLIGNSPEIRNVERGWPHSYRVGTRVEVAAGPTQWWENGCAYPATIAAWAANHRIESLNVIGPRESTLPGIYGHARTYLERLLELIRIP